MNYFNYAIKCVIRNIIYKLMKPRNLAIIIVSIVIIFLLSSYTSVFGWTGDDDYTDKNATIVMNYDSINQDLLNRIKYYTGGNPTNIENLVNDLKNNNFNYYVFYGSATDGSSMTGQTIFANFDLYIYFYQRDIVPDSSVYDMYQGMETSFKKINTGNIYGYIFEGGNVSTFTPPSTGFHIPTVLINYKSSVIYDYINSDSQSQTNSIVGAINNQTDAINNQTNTINQQTQVIQDTQDFITDDTITSSNMNISTTGMTVSDSNNVFGFLQNFFTNLRDFFSNISDDVQTIEIPMPHNMQSIYIRSDIVSSRIQGTFLFTLIQTLWYFVFGTYLLFYVKHLINFFSTGEFATTGLAHFLEHLENEDVIIRSTMM